MSPSSSKRHTFEAVIEAGRGDGAWVAVPDRVTAAFGSRGQVKVKASFDGEAYRGSLAPMGGGIHVLGVTKAIRRAIGKSIGDRVRVVVERDSEPRQVPMPKDLQAALAENGKAKDYFDSLAYTYRREYVRWIESARRQETRLQRVETAVEKLLRREKL